MEKYTAIKVKGLSYWLWFKSEKVTREDGKFKGTDGWGKGGALINFFEVSDGEIVGTLTSKELGYN